MHRYTARLAIDPDSLADAWTWTGDAHHVHHAAKLAMARACVAFGWVPADNGPEVWIVAYAATPDTPIATITVDWTPGRGWFIP